MSMGVHHPYPLDLCAYDEDPSQLIIRPGWDAPHVRCSPRTFCAWPCLLRQVGTVLGSPYDCVVARLAYANPGSRQWGSQLNTSEMFWIDISRWMISSRCSWISVYLFWCTAHAFEPLPFFVALLPLRCVYNPVNCPAVIFHLA